MNRQGDKEICDLYGLTPEERELLRELEPINRKRKIMH